MKSNSKELTKEMVEYIDNCDENSKITFRNFEVQFPNKRVRKLEDRLTITIKD
jgi:hypothetical protein